MNLYVSLCRVNSDGTYTRIIQDLSIILFVFLRTPVTSTNPESSVSALILVSTDLGTVGRVLVNFTVSTLTLQYHLYWDRPILYLKIIL